MNPCGFIGKRVDCRIHNIFHCEQEYRGRGEKKNDDIIYRVAGYRKRIKIISRITCTDDAQ